MECTGISAYGDGGDTLSHRTVTARKAHACCECRRIIKKKEDYELQKIVCDGEIRRYKTCSDCISLRDAFFNRYVFGSVWDDFYEYVSENYGDEIKWSALSKLTKHAQRMAFDCIEMIWDRIEEGEDE